MDAVLKAAVADDERLYERFTQPLRHPPIDPSRYYRQVATDPYFAVLSVLRHHIRAVSDAYFSGVIGARNIDLFLMTSSVSSPAGPGSDSTPIPLSFGGLHTYLVDSSQFGFEPILLGGIPRAYCYLPSLRGEDPDERHLNQFYHCEYEAQEPFAQAQLVAEGYVRALATLLRAMPHTVELLSFDPAASNRVLAAVLETNPFDSIAFDTAVTILADGGYSEGVRMTPHGADITSRGELFVLQERSAVAPVWVTNFHRDRVPFYQKPDPENSDRVINGDLLFAPIRPGGFGGEILGMGQRQDTAEEMYESLRRQGVDPLPYEWYVDLRRMPYYVTTSGFGLGIERFIAWALGFERIADAIVYPRMKGVLMHP